MKVRPVRWWRDDATRYAKRGTSALDIYGPSPIELVRSIPDPLQAELLAYFERVEQHRIAIPTSNSWDETDRTPIDDVSDVLGMNRARPSDG